ncbi:MAG TPA: hypothetical protein VNU47_02685 [Candidatus Paceibacterota bacterium]|nr:hypothetical protein [Candidatus Paceibacterota bacterium]
MKLSRNTIIVIVFIVLSLGIAAYFFLGRDTEDDAVVTQSSVGSTAEILFINLASQIQSIEFDDELLLDPRFTKLIDIRVVVVPEAEGRRDPFAELGAR